MFTNHISLLIHHSASYFADSLCSTLLSFNAFIDNDCIADSESTSILANYPTKYTYSKTSNCTGPSTFTKYVSSCTATGTATSSFTYISSTYIGNESSSSNSNSLNTVEIIMVIVGGVVGCLLIAVILYYLAIKIFFTKDDSLLNNHDQVVQRAHSYDRNSSTSSVQQSFKF